MYLAYDQNIQKIRKIGLKATFLLISSLKVNKDSQYKVRLEDKDHSNMALRLFLRSAVG